MSVPVWSVVKFKIKEGCEDDFLAAHVFEDSHMKYMKSFKPILICFLQAQRFKKIWVEYVF